MTRWARLLRNCRAKHKFPHGDETYFASYFLWCGHIARIATRDPMRETSKLFMHRNIAWLRSLKKEERVHNVMDAVSESGGGSRQWINVLEKSG